MTASTICIIVLIIAAAAAGYGISSSSNLQQAFHARKVSRRTAELLCVTVVFAFVWFKTAGSIYACTPAVALALYGFYWSAIWALRRCAKIKVSLGTFQDWADTVLLTGTAVALSLAVALLVFHALFWFIALPAPALALTPQEAEFCQGILLWVLTLLLLFLIHQLGIYCLRMNEDENNNKALFQLRRKLRKPSSM